MLEVLLLAVLVVPPLVLLGHHLAVSARRWMTGWPAATPEELPRQHSAPRIQALARTPFVESPPDVSEATRRCPDCTETIKVAARVCKHCGLRLDAAPRHAPRSAHRRPRLRERVRGAP
jgi:hypothetical protein